MLARKKPFLYSAISMILLIASLSCSLFTPPAAPTQEPTQSSALIPRSAPPAVPLRIDPQPPEKPALLPAPTRIAASANDIDIFYNYTTELITVIYPLYGSILDDFLTVSLTNTGQTPASLIVESALDGYTDQSHTTIQLDAGETKEVRQNPRLRPQVIDQLNSTKPATFHLRILYLDNGLEKTILNESQQITLFGRRDFPWAIEGLSEQEDFELITSMVMPNDPAVEGLIRAAADHISQKTMWNGYGGHENDDDGGVWNRLEAIWLAEAKDYNLTYISTPVTYAPGDVQRIRLPSEVLDQKSGNCIELAVLFASAAEALELETAIIRIPGHAYMAVRIDQTHKNYYVIETTMIGRYSFSEAVRRGSQELNDALPRLDAGEHLYDWITVSNARKKGILPLPWH
jgi:hypothetical protein